MLKTNFTRNCEFFLAVCVSYSGAPNDQFVVKCIIIPQLMKINVIKAFSGVFLVLLGKHYLFLFPSKTHKKFPSQLDKIGWFPSQLINFISQPGIPRAFKSLDPKRPNKSDKTGTKQVFSACAITLTSRRMFVTTLWKREGVLFFFFFFSRPRSSEFLQPARVEMLEKVSNSQAKTSINNKISQPANRNTCIFASQQDSSGEQIM